jgi:predicted metal-dependent peptidase
VRIREHLRGEAGGSGDVRGTTRVAKELPRAIAYAANGELSWAAILRALLRSPALAQPTYTRPNRRFPSRVGEVPGRLRRSRRPRLLVGIDTSASMTAETLGRAVAEVERLRRCADCTVAEVDAAVQRVHHHARVEMVIGGGDTDYEPLFGLVPNRHAFDGIVYITDGAGAWPALAPPVPVLWVLTTAWAFDCPWGTVVRLMG